MTSNRQEWIPSTLCYSGNRFFFFSTDMEYLKWHPSLKDSNFQAKSAVFNFGCCISKGAPFRLCILSFSKHKHKLSEFRMKICEFIDDKHLLYKKQLHHPKKVNWNWKLNFLECPIIKHLILSPDSLWRFCPRPVCEDFVPGLFVKNVDNS